MIYDGIDVINIFYFVINRMMFITFSQGN